MGQSVHMARENLDRAHLQWPLLILLLVAGATLALVVVLRALLWRTSPLHPGR